MTPGETGVFRIPALGRRVLTRFLGKVGLGLVAAQLGQSAFEPRYDQIRHYVRVGNKPRTWAAARGVVPEHEVFSPRRGTAEEDVTVYSYGLGAHANGIDVLFALQYGFDAFAMYLTRPEADRDLLHCLLGMRLDPL
jgi:hypothetical protein